MTAHSDVGNQEDLGTIAEDYWKFYLKEHPSIAMGIDETAATPQFHKASTADFERRHGEHHRFRERLQKFLSDAESNSSNEALLRRELDEAITNFELCGHLRPLWFPFGPDMETSYAMQMSRVDSPNSVERYLERLSSLDSFFRDSSNRLKEGFERGYRVPNVLAGKIVTNIRSHIRDPGDVESSWFAPIRPLASRNPGLYRRALEDIESVARDSLLPAWHQFGDEVEATFKKGTRERNSVLGDIEGEAYYAYLVQHHTTTDMTAGEIHEIGIGEVDRIHSAMQDVANKWGQHGGLPALQKHLRESADFVSGSKEDLLQTMEVLSKNIDSRIPELFGHLPRMTYGLQSIPEEASGNMPPAYAQPNPPSKAQAGTHWVTSLPEKCPSYMHVPLALHEAWPGHLMHIALLQENTSQPDFVRYGYMNYTAMLEGWALYCEKLGYDLGLYDDVYKKLGQLEMEMWRAVRLVVDTGLHLKFWPREKAIDYMSTHLSLPQETIAAEVDRYIGMPGQALAYKIGELKLLGLRKKAQRSLKGRFDLRAFHDCVLGAGVTTLPILEDIVQRWVAEQAGRYAQGAGA